MRSLLRVLVTGSAGFIGRNLVARMKELGNYEILEFRRQDALEAVAQQLDAASFVVHLAAVNRSESDEAFFAGNAGFTQELCTKLKQTGLKVPVLFSSTIHATSETPYGRSKREAEEILARYAEESGAHVMIYRLPHVFGRWCRPNYNSVVATFCHNVARGFPIEVWYPEKAIELAYIDDVVHAIVAELDRTEASGVYYRNVPVTHTTTLAELADTIRSFKASKEAMTVPDRADPLIRKLYATYLTYLETAPGEMVG